MFFSLLSSISYFPQFILSNHPLSIEILLFTDNIGLIFLVFSFFAVFLHYEALSSLKPDLRRYTIIIVFGVAALTTILIEFIISSAELSKINLLKFFIGDIFGLLCFTYPLVVSVKINKRIKERAAQIELFSIIVIQLSNILYFLKDLAFIFNLTLDPLSLEIFNSADVILLIGIILLISNYIIHSNYIYLLPFPIHEFFIINKSGIVSYHRHISNINLTYFQSTDRLLISGVIKAISSLIPQILDTSAQLRYIDAKSYKIHLSHIAKENVIIAIVASRINYYLKKSLNHFKNSITKETLNKIQNTIIIDRDLYKQLDKILLRTFPYLDIRRENIE